MRFTAKSKDSSCDLIMWQASIPHIKIGVHLLTNNCTTMHFLICCTTNFSKNCISRAVEQFFCMIKVADYGFFWSQNALKPFSTGVPSWTSLGELTTLPQTS